MKKISLLVVVLVIACLHSFAQTEKGSLFSGPSLGISYNHSSSKYSTNSVKSTSLQFPIFAHRIEYWDKSKSLMTNCGDVIVNWAR